MQEFLVAARNALETVLFTIGSTQVTVATLLSVVTVIIATFWVSRILRALVTRALSARGGKPGAIGTVTGLIHYGVLIVGFGVALSTAGIDLTALFAAGAIFAVGLGFAMQSIAQNFVAGVILLAERAIKPGDILEVEGKIVKVVEMGIRSSVAHTRDGEDLIIPNATLIQTTVTNFTLRNSAYRIRLPVGVIYGSDMRLVKETLTAVANRMHEKWGSTDRNPLIALTAFGAHSVDWEIGVWIDDPWEWRPATSDLHEAVWWAFQERGIVIAFPQLDVHLDAPVMETLRQLAGRQAA